MTITEPQTKFSQRTTLIGEEAEDSVRRMRLMHLASEGTAALKREGLAEIGSLSVALARHDDDWSYFAHLRSEPQSSHGGAEFRFSMQRSDPTDDHAVIREIIASAQKFVHNKEVIGAKTRAARVVAKELIESTTSFDWPAKLVSIGCENGFENAIVFDLEILEYDLQMSRTRVVSRDKKYVALELDMILDSHERRANLRHEMRQAGIDFLVDGAAKSILEAVGLDVSNTVRKLGDKRVIEFLVRGTDGCNYDGAVFFEHGVLMADLTTEKIPIRFRTDELVLFDTGLPETVIASLSGCALGGVVRLPWLPADAIITDAQGEPNELYIKLRCPRFGMTEEGLTLCEDPLQASSLL